MTNTPTRNLKTVWLFLFFACVPFLVSAKTIAKEPLQTFNCPPFVDLVLNSSDDIPNSINAWLTSGNELLINSLPNGNTAYTVSNDYGGTPPTAVCNVGEGGIQVVFTASSNLIEASQSCTANIIIIDNEVVIEECPATGLFLNIPTNIEAAISFWLNNTENLVQTAAANQEGNDSLGEITVTNDYDGSLSNTLCDGVTDRVIVTFTATDECGNTAQCQGGITIAEMRPFLDCSTAADVTVDCNADISSSNIGIPFLIMPDGPGFINDATLTHEDDDSNLENCTGTILRTWTATNTCGQTTICVQTITIIPAIEEVSPCQEIEIQSIDNQLIISNIQAANPIVKIFDSNYQIIFDCSGDCPETIMVSNLNAGEIYHTDIQFYDENWQFICEDKQDILIEGGNEPCDTSICYGNIFYNTQAAVDAFCNCTVIDGNLTISGEDINSLESLNTLKEVKGYIIIGATRITDFNGFENLTSIGTLFQITNNPSLKNLNGLSKLEKIGDDLIVRENDSLDNFEGLLNLEQVRIIDITNNQSLKSIESLNSPSGVQSIIITDNDSLLTLDGLNDITRLADNRIMEEETPFIHTSLSISGNDALISLGALKNLIFAEEDVSISANLALSDCCGIAQLIDDNPDNGQINGQIFIDNNLVGCHSIEEVLTNCQNNDTSCENIQILTQNNQIVIEGLTAPNEIVKVFDKDFNIVYQCVANCEETQMAGTFPAGMYVIDLQLYDENWDLICSEQRTVVLENGDPCNGTDCETIPPVLANIPADITAECDAVPEIFFNVTATDNCDSDVEVQFEETRTDGSCVDNYTLTRTWTAYDDCGNSAARTQTVVIIDSTSPILTNLPPDLTFNAIDGFDTTFPISTDNCASNPTLTVEDVVNPEETEIVRTFTATDNCGNTATAQQIITIIQDGNNPCEAINITTSAEAITLTNIAAPNSIVKVFDANYQIIFDCTATCENEVVVPVVGAGIYHTDVQFYDADWQFICKDRQDIEVINDGEPCDTSICQGDVIFQTQAEVDAFCGCAVIEGDLLIEGMVNNLKNLNKLKLIKGGLIVSKSKLENFDGLENLLRIDKNMTITESILVDFKGLDSLEKIGSFFYLAFNPLIKNVDHLANLKEIGESLTIRENPKLERIKGLHKIKKLSNLTFILNESLKSLDGLENLDSINSSILEDGSFFIGSHDNLEDINALQNIDFIEKRFNIRFCPKIQDCCPIAHLVDNDSENGFVGIRPNGIGQGTPSYCDGIFAILENCSPEEDALCKFVQIRSAFNDLFISNLDASIEILKVFDANYNIIYECFADCEDQLQVLNLAAGTYHVNINFYDENWQLICERTETVQIEASTQNRSANLLPEDFGLFPNPAQTETYIDLKKLQGATVQLALYNQFGQLVQEQTIEKVDKAKLDLSAVQNGLYILKIETKNRKAIAKKLIVNRLY